MKRVSRYAGTDVTVLATTGVHAPRSSCFDNLQALIGYLRVYGGTGCQEPWSEDIVFQQGIKCMSNTYAGPYGSFNIQTNGITRTIQRRRGSRIPPSSLNMRSHSQIDAGIEITSSVSLLRAGYRSRNVTQYFIRFLSAARFSAIAQTHLARYQYC
jgi:hypothetical protein